jgi:hypothetical protein
LAKENIDEFSDYLEEFEDNLIFDSETCPVCGVNLSGNISIHPIPLIELKFENEKYASEAIKKIEEGGIKTKQSGENNDVVLIAEQKFQEVKKILEKK